MTALRWYRYAPEWLGDGGIRLAGPDIERVEDPEAADCIVVGQPMFVPFRDPEKWRRLWSEPLILRDPKRVVIADCSDDRAIPSVQGCIYWRGGLTADQLREYPSAVSAPWPSPDLSVWEDLWWRPKVQDDRRCRGCGYSVPREQKVGDPVQGHYVNSGNSSRYCEGSPERLTVPGFQHDVSFVGWRTPLDVTARSIASCEKAGLRCRFSVFPDFHGHRHPKAGNHRPGDPTGDPETDRREAEYREALFGSRLVLCPESIRGVLRYRVTECSAAARIPVIVGNDYVLPFEDFIPWREIAIQVNDTAGPENVGEILVSWLRGRSDEEILARGRLGQALWRRWLAGARHPEILAEVVRERLGVL